MAQTLTHAKNLLTPRADFLMLGGLSLAFMLAFHFFVPASQNTHTVAWTMYYLSFAVNYPHFLLSYQLLYVDHRQDIFKKPHYFWAGVLCPLILIATIAWGFAEASPTIFPLLVQVMFISVGWHYIKQIFGTMVVSAAQSGFFYSNIERWALRVNLFALAILSFIASQRSTAMADFYGIKYQLLGLPDWSYYTCFSVVGISLLLFILLSVRRYIITGAFAPGLAWLPLITIYAWYIPTMHHPHFFLLIPFFHSLQYLLFVFALKKNLWRQQSPNFSDPSAQRKYYITKHFNYFGSALALGALAFWAIPVLLDKNVIATDPKLLSLWGPGIFLAVFTLFLNIHHYFIDNVIWRKDNEQMKKAFF